MSISRAFAGGACAGLCLATLVLCSAAPRRAHAFGGLWASPESPSVEQTALRVILVDEPGPTVTAVVDVQDTGAARDFAWVIPVRGRPKVGFSSNAVFERLAAATAPEYWVEVALGDSCEKPDGEGPGDEPIGVAPSEGPIFVDERGTIGPYDFVTLAFDEAQGDPVTAAGQWLVDNGYATTPLDGDVLRPYLEDGMNLLAFRLTRGADGDAIRPVSVTYRSARPMIPLLPAALSAGPDMSAQVWVVGEAQAVPANYPSLVLNDALIDWLGGRAFDAGTLPAGGAGPFGGFVERPPNYDAVVGAAADEAGGHGFVTELAGPASQYRDKLWAALDEETFSSLTSASYEDGIDALYAASVHYARWDGWRDAVAGATTLPEGVTLEQFGMDPDRYRGVAEVDIEAFFRILEVLVVAPVADTAELFYAGPYLTRFYTTLSPDEMTLDPIFDYNADLAQVGNVHIARQAIECEDARGSQRAPWRIELPQGGIVTGEGGAPWPVALGSMPANLKLVMLSSGGEGDVLEDNRREIGDALFELSGIRPSGMPQLQAAQNGVTIGGAQTLLAPREPGPQQARLGVPRLQHRDCSVTRAGVGAGADLSPLVVLLGLGFVLGLRRTTRSRRVGIVLGACLLLGACSDDAGGKSPGEDAGAMLEAGALTLEELRDPESCKGCHPAHYREWSASMHAYSAQDPVFLAMNRRGQRETNGKLGDFCLKCHAPMAVYDGLTQDGLDLEELPDLRRGVSCYFCHNVAGIEGDHNGKLRLAGDRVMRGPIEDPLRPGAHEAQFSALFEDTSPEGSAMCGGCHDIVTPSGVRLERTFEEYRNGIFSRSPSGEPPAFDSCMGCHMPPREGLAAKVAGAQPRAVHEHLWPGIDVAVTDFPHREAMRSAVEDCQLGRSVPFFTLEVTPPDLFTFQIQTGAGHNTPSGAAQDRRMWLEFLAYDASGELLESSSGHIADGEFEEKPPGEPGHDPNLVMFRDRIYDARGRTVHMFWEAEKSNAHPYGYESHTLPVATTTYIEGKHAVVKQYRASGPEGLPARVTARLRMRPIGIDVLQDLVDSGDLDPAVLDEMPTFSFGVQIEWTPQDGLMKTIAATPESDCVTYRCLLDPTSKDCD